MEIIMKAFLVVFLCVLSLNAQSEILNANDNIFARRDQDNYGKTPTEIMDESIDNYENFVDMDVNADKFSKTALNDADKPTILSMDDAETALNAAETNPVVSLHSYSKYDPEDKGIGFCFGRAMFVNLYLAMNGFSRANIKKAFVIGPMSNGAWGWHVSTIVQSKTASGKEIWLAIDPVAGRIMEVQQWYKHWRKESDDKKLRLYITEAGKFGPGSYSKYDENAISDDFYNKYFIDMMKWFAKADFTKNKELSF
jgi:hypothetical protein